LEYKDFINKALEKLLITNAETSVSAAEELISASRAYFKTTYTVREKLLKVYYFESVTDKISLSTKKIIFQDMKELDLAQKAADLLPGMAIKIVM
jgi:hypothetical protein